METAERLVRTWVALGGDKEIEVTAAGIATGEIKLLHVVKALGDYLTSEEEELRAKGVEFLASVVGQCPPDKFSRQAVKVLIQFFTSKLEDTETIIPALKGILNLTPLPSFISDDAIEISRNLFARVKMQALVQVQRYVVFSIIDWLIARHRDALISISDEFITGYAALADGEKDPRNLLLAFSIDRVIIIEFDITNNIETLFNITFCYFPITFRPPPDDPYGITADDLKKALRSCLSATPAFGASGVTLFLEKLAAGSPSTKLDVLETMDVCLPVYGSSLARITARDIWKILRLEIFQPTNSSTEIAALKTMRVLIKTIYADEGEGKDSDEDIAGLAKEACEECIQILREPEKSQAKFAIKVLCAFMSTTPSVSRYTISQCVPHLVKLFYNPDELPNRGPVLSLLTSLIAAARDSTVKVLSTADSQAPKDVPLLPFKDEVLGAYTVGLKAPSSAHPAIDGLLAMVTTPGLLEDEEIGFVVQNVNDVLASDRQDLSDVSDAALNLLTTISTLAPIHISHTTLPLLFSALPDCAPSRSDIQARTRLWNTLTSLARLCAQADLFETLVVRLSTKLDLLCSPADPADEVVEDSEPAAAYAHAILTTIAKVLSEKVDRGDVDVPKYIDRLVPRLFNLFVYSALVAGRSGKEPVATDTRLVRVAGQIVSLVMQALPAQKQESFVTALMDAYLKGEVAKIAVGYYKIPADAHFAPFGVRIPVDDQGAFLDMLLQWSIHRSETSIGKDAAWHIVAAVINKREQDIGPFLSTKLESFWPSELSDSAIRPETRQLAISAWVWIAKGLLVRNHPQAMSFVDRLFTLFDDKDVSWNAARAIGQVVASDRILTKKNRAVIRILYAQKYANAVLPRIIAGAKSPENPRKQTAHLVALTSLIKSIPTSAYAHEMPTLMPLLLRGLDLSDFEIRANVIDTLLAAAQADLESDAKKSKWGSVVTEHASSLATTMLKNSIVSDMPNMRVRIAALRLLAILPRVVRYDVLHPQKQVVLRELGKALDDPKRVVRKEAVDARASWFTYSG
ncbi:hypothetical protein EW146_g2870 [Bondarzewia mesenterica]|uniref:MMS19 nucleotide excision repair protein n=1 Tax=Bondarzewia mesenterica TaxID=1095465 RepID=A0A4S4LZN1_9AGAM|nr:hypothetical protein EW146_g2870 [Bondarzewia mesenterica]